MDRVLGLDSGGTKTIAAVAERSGSVVWMATGAGLDPISDPGWEGSLAGLLAPVGVVAAATFGLPFHTEIAEISARQSEVAAALVSGRVSVLNDVAVAFEGAFCGQDGVLVLAGTGSMAWAQGPKGTVRTGGWGDAFGDEGSAFWIGRAALACVSRSLDGRSPAPAFAEALLAHLGISAEQLIGWTYRGSGLRVQVASVARHVSALATAQDGVALGLMEQAAVHLADIADAAIRAAGLQAPARWSHAGGVFGDATLAGAVSRRMGRAPAPPRLPPIGGAILHAAKSAGWKTDAGFIARLGASLGAQHLRPSHPAAAMVPGGSRAPGIRSGARDDAERKEPDHIDP